MPLAYLTARMLRVALLMLGVLRAAAGCSPSCPNVQSGHSKDEYCIARPGQNCKDPQNYDCPPCSLWKTIDKLPASSCTYHYTSVQASQGGTNPSWLIEPCIAVSGIEIILNHQHVQDLNFLWKRAWDDAAHGSNGRPHISPAQLGLVINSFYYRSRHQMHIHAAKLDDAFAAPCLKTLPSSFKTQWSSPSPNCNFKMVSQYAPNLDRVNSMIIAGADALNKKFKTSRNLIGAMVSGNPHGSSGYTVTVFEGNDYHGDHDILLE